MIKWRFEILKFYKNFGSSCHHYQKHELNHFISISVLYRFVFEWFFNIKWNCHFHISNTHICVLLWNMSLILINKNFRIQLLNRHHIYWCKNIKVIDTVSGILTTYIKALFCCQIYIFNYETEMFQSLSYMPSPNNC